MVYFPLKHSCLQYIILCRVCDFSHAVLHVCVTLTITVALLVSSGIPSTLVLIPHMRREWYLPTSSPSLNQDCTGNLWPWQQVQMADSNCGPCKRGRLSEVERHSLLFIFVLHCRYSTLQFFLLYWREESGMGLSLSGLLWWGSIPRCSICRGWISSGCGLWAGKILVHVQYYLAGWFTLVLSKAYTKTLKMASLMFQISIFFWEPCPRIPLDSRNFGAPKFEPLVTKSWIHPRGHPRLLWSAMTSGAVYRIYSTVMPAVALCRRSLCGSLKLMNWRRHCLCHFQMRRSGNKVDYGWTLQQH